MSGSESYAEFRRQAGGPFLDNRFSQVYPAESQRGVHRREGEYQDLGCPDHGPSLSDLRRLKHDFSLRFRNNPHSGQIRNRRKTALLLRERRVHQEYEAL